MNVEFPYIVASGSAFQMGVQNGKQSETLIKGHLLWIERLAGLNRNVLRANAMRFLPYIERFSSKYAEEISGLAEGARIPLADAVLCQTRAEAARRWEGGCTAFAVLRGATAGGRIIAGQNQDLELDFADVGVVLRIVPNDGRPRAVMFTFAGQLGYAGLNQYGVCNFANALYNYKWTPGLPSYPVRRVLLEQRSVNHCVNVLKRTRTCSAMNVVLADAQGEIADVESRPEAIAVYTDNDPSVRLHTNHYLTNEFADFENGTLADSVPRLARARALLRNSWGKTTVDTMKQILADHDGWPAAICRHGAADLHSIAGYIAEPEKGLLHVRRGYGCDGACTPVASNVFFPYENRLGSRKFPSPQLCSY